jgi:hypothetical protein
MGRTNGKYKIAGAGFQTQGTRSERHVLAGSRIAERAAVAGALLGVRA